MENLSEDPLSYGGPTQLFNCQTSLKPYRSKTCPFKTQLLVNLKAHFQNYHSVKHETSQNVRIRNYVCGNCCFATHFSLKWLDHVKSECSKTSTSSFESLETEPEWELHLHTYSKPANWFKCELCRFETSTKRNLKRHTINKHTNEKMYKCDQCEFVTKTKQYLKVHMWKHTDEEVKFQCDLCDFTTKSDRNLKCHRNRKHTFHCDECEFKAVKLSAIRQHIAMKHAGEKDSTSSNQSDSLKCRYMFPQGIPCNFVCMTTSQLKTHILELHQLHSTGRDSRWYECEYCDHVCKESYLLSKHKVLNHPGEITNPTIEKYFSCKKCDFKTDLEKDLISHNKNTHVKNEKEQIPAWFFCKTCPFQTKVKQTLKNHIITIHTDEKDIKWNRCKQCDFKAKLETNLHLHEKRMHSVQTRWFQCDHCEYKTKDKRCLGQHIRRKHPRE